MIFCVGAKHLSGQLFVVRIHVHIVLVDASEFIFNFNNLLLTNLYFRNHLASSCKHFYQFLQYYFLIDNST